MATPYSRHLIRSFSGATALRVLGAILQFSLGVAVSRISGIRETGFFYLALSIASVISVASRLGMEYSLIRVVARYRHEGHLSALINRVHVSLQLASILAAAAAATLWLLSKTYLDEWYHDATPAIGMIAIAIPAMTLAGLLSEVLKGLNRPLIGTAVQTCIMPAIAIPTLVILARHGTTSGAGAAAAITVGSYFATACGLVLWKISRPPANLQSPGWRETWRSDAVTILGDVPSLLSITLITAASHWVGTIVLGAVSSPDDVAGFTAAMRSSITVSLLISAATTIAAPRLAVLSAGNDLAQLKRLSQGLSLLLALSALPFLLVMVFYPHIVMSIFGHAFLKFSYLLPILCIGQCAAAVIGHSGTVLLMAHHDREARSSSTTALATNGLANIILTPLLGATGAALAAALGQLSGHLVAMYRVRTVLGFYPIYIPFISSPPWIANAGSENK